MSILITGALGFIGSHLAEAFIARGDAVVGLDDLSGNVVDRVDGMGECWVADAREVPTLPFGRIDMVVHAASPVGPVALLERPSIVAEIIETTQAVVEFCRAHRVPLVNISTSEVYGFSGVYRETDDCVIPHALPHRIQYAVGKLAAEHLVRTSGVTAVSIRPFNIAGPRQASSKGFVLPTFCEQALAGEPLTVFDGGDQERCPTAVWDLVDFVLNHAQFTAGEAKVVNVGNARNRTTVLDLARRVLAVTGSASEIKFTSGKTIHGPDYEEAIGRVKVPDTTFAESMGWQARVGLDEMVARTVADIQAKAVV